MIRELIAWWVEQMLQWVPTRWRAPDQTAADALIVELIDAGQAVSVVLRRQRRERSLGRVGLDAAGLRDLRKAMPARFRPDTIILRLPPGLLLERDVVLPLAAEREPERVLTYEMDRITPFTADEVFWTHTVDRRDRANGRLSLRLAMVLRAAVQDAVASLGQAGLVPAALEAPSADGTMRRIVLAHPDSRRARLERRVLTGVQAVCGALAVAAFVLPFILQWSASRRIEAQIGRLQPRVAEAEQLRQRIASTTAGVDVIAAERLHVGDAISVLAAVTALLPDDTSLTDLTLRQGKLTISGQSAEAVRLIAALSGNPALHNPEFTAPVTRIENGRTDLFAIRAGVTP